MGASGALKWQIDHKVRWETDGSIPYEAMAANTTQLTSNYLSMDRGTDLSGSNEFLVPADEGDIIRSGSNELSE